MINPDYYQLNGKEAIYIFQDIMSDEEFRGYCKGCIFKYLIRYMNKGGKDDLAKAKRYLEFLEEFENEKE